MQAYFPIVKILRRNVMTCSNRENCIRSFSLPHSVLAAPIKRLHSFVQSVSKHLRLRLGPVDVKSTRLSPCALPREPAPQPPATLKYCCIIDKTSSIPLIMLTCSAMTLVHIPSHHSSYKRRKLTEQRRILTHPRVHRREADTPSHTRFTLLYFQSTGQSVDKQSCRNPTESQKVTDYLALQ